MAAELKSALGLDASLTRGRGGVFIIRRDGRVVYDKADTDRFPTPGEAARLLGA